MTSTTYYHHNPSSNSTSSSTTSRNYSLSSATSSPTKYSTQTSTTNIGKSYTSKYCTSSGYTYKTRSSYDLNNASSAATYRPSSYITSSTSTYSTYTSPSSTSFSPKTASSYLTSKYATGSSTFGSSYNATPILTRFNHRRSSLDFNDDNQIESNTSNKTKIPVAGLQNLGNTCYMNSVIQALFATKQLRDYIINGLESGQLYSALSSLFKEMLTAATTISRYSSAGQYVNPLTFHSTFTRREPKFKGNQQQDAQEFLSYLIFDLHEEQNKAKSRTRGTIYEPKSASEGWSYYRSYFADSKFVDLFVGQFSSVIKCSDCGNESTCYDPFWDISLPVPRYRNRVDIEECLAEFTSAETLDGDEKPFCSKCKQHRKSTKRLSIVRSPKILVLHLKKFSNDGYKLSSDIVINQQIKIEINTNERILHKTSYELYACVCHHGISSRSGHYTAYCQYYDFSKWYHCDDQKVKEVTDSFSMNTLKDAYVLFYRLQDSSSTFSSRL